MGEYVDARSLSDEAREALRMRAVRAVLGGMRKVDAAEAFGVHPNVIGRWMRRYDEGGWEGLRERRKGRRPGEQLTLAPVWRDRLVAVMREHTPDELGLAGFHGRLWTRAAVAELIFQRVGVRLEVTTVGRYLRRWGLSPQKPARRALERDPVKVRRWLEETHPALRARAKRERGVVMWLDEMGVRSDAAAGRSYAPRGETPVVPASGQRFGINQISAIDNTGGLRFMLFERTCTADVVITFLDRLVYDMVAQDVPGRGYEKVLVVLDGHPSHKASAVREWVGKQQGRIELHFLPGYSPHLNPVELLNHDVKANAVGRRLVRDEDELRDHVHGYLRLRQDQPEVVAGFFRHPDVRYAAL